MIKILIDIFVDRDICITDKIVNRGMCILEIIASYHAARRSHVSANVVEVCRDLGSLVRYIQTAYSAGTTGAGRVLAITCSAFMYMLGIPTFSCCFTSVSGCAISTSQPWPGEPCRLCTDTVGLPNCTPNVVAGKFAVNFVGTHQGNGSKAKAFLFAHKKMPLHTLLLIDHGRSR